MMLATICFVPVVSLSDTFIYLFPIIIPVAVICLFILSCKPQYVLYLLFAVLVILTDSVSSPIPGIFAVTDLKPVVGLPPMLISTLLLLCTIYFAKLYLIDRKRSRLPLKYASVTGVLLLASGAVGLNRGADPIDLRVDFYNVLFPVLCYYLCLNLLDTRRKVYTMLSILFVVCTIDAVILDVYYLLGNGWPYSRADMNLTRIVTQDTKSLMLFTTMIITAYSASVSKLISGWRSRLALVCCVPMVFAIVFSFRRSLWLGVIASLIVFYALSSASQKHSIRVLVPAALFLFAVIALFSESMTTTDVGSRFALRLASFADPAETSNQHHMLESAQTAKDILAHPFLGLGLGSSHSPVYNIDWAPDDQPTKIVHNTFLLIWMKLGLPGLVAFLWISFRYVMSIHAYSRRTQPNHPDPIIAALGSSWGLWLILLCTGPVLAYWYQTMAVALLSSMESTLLAQHSASTQIMPTRLVYQHNRRRPASPIHTVTPGFVAHYRLTPPDRAGAHA